jgi:GNAT superfamily N-acetyltransferase
MPTSSAKSLYPIRSRLPKPSRLREGGQPVGRAGLFEVGDIGRIKDVHVVPGVRRRGVGSALMAHVLTLARRLAVAMVCLEVDQADRGAVAFFESCGFVPDGSIYGFDAPAP